MQTDPSKVFLSHNSLDKPDVGIIKGLLGRGDPVHGDCPIPCWFDKDDLRSSGTWISQLEEAVAMCDAAVVFFGPGGRGPVHKYEIDLLLKRAMYEKGRDAIRLILVLLPGAQEQAVQGFLSLHMWADFRNGLDDAGAIQRLRALILGEAPRSGPGDDPLTPKPEIEPYRGLEPFDRKHAICFFGRDEEIRKLCSRLNDWPCTAVIGGSGSGKSSLVRAGLQTELARRERGALAQTTTIIMRPGTSPIRALAEQIVASIPEPSEIGDDRLMRIDTYEQRLCSGSGQLLNVLGSLFLKDDQHLLLVIDQFEELFTHGPADQPIVSAESGTPARDGETQQFVALLAAVAASGRERLRIVITLRADFFDRCLRVPTLKGILENRTLLLGQLSDEALRSVIETPAIQVGAYFEKGLVARILKDVQNQNGSLPLLQHALKELWERRRFGFLTDDAYSETGGVEGALKKRANATLENLSREQREIAKNVFLRLTTLGQDVPDTRRRVPRRELYPDNTEPGLIDAVLNTLCSQGNRLIVTNDDGSVEVTHEALIQRWDTLKGWLADNRDDKRLQDRLRDAANEWADPKHNRDPSYLWEGGRLELAERFVENHKGMLNDLEQAFVAASIGKRERKRNEEDLRQQRELASSRKAARLAWGLTSVATVAALIFLFLFGFALRMKWDAEAAKAIANGKTLEANELVVTTRRQQYVSDMNLASQAGIDQHFVRMRELLERHTWVSRSKDLKGLEDLREFEWYYLWRVCHGKHAPLVGHSGLVFALDFAPEQPILASGGEDHQVCLWDLSTRPYHMLVMLKGHVAPIISVEFSPDGKWLASGDEGGTVKIWKMDEHTEFAQFSSAGPVNCLHFDRDSSSIVVGTGILKAGGGELAVWDLNTQTDVFRRAGTESVFHVAYVPGTEQILSVAGTTHTVSIHNAKTGDLVETKEALGLSSKIDVSPDGSLMVIASAQDARVVTTDTWETKFDFRGQRNFQNLAFSSNGTALAACQENGPISIWDINGKEIDHFDQGVSATTCLGLYAPDIDQSNLRAAWGSSDDGVVVWDHAPESRVEFQWNHRAAVQHLGFSPDGYHIFTVCRYNVSPSNPTAAQEDHRVEVKVWDALAERIVYECSDLDIALAPMALDLSGRYLAAFSNGNTLEIRDLETGRKTQAFDVGAGAVRAVGFTRDNLHLVTLADAGSVHLWDRNTGQRIRSFGGLESGTALALSDDGASIAAAGGNTINVWNMISGQLVGSKVSQFPSSELSFIRQIAFRSDDEQIVAIGRPGQTETMTLATMQSPFVSYGLSAQGYDNWPDNLMAANPDGTRLATVVLHGRIKIWDLRTDQELLTLKSPEGRVKVLSFSPGGRMLVCGCENGLVQLWRAAIEEEVQRDLD